MKNICCFAGHSKDFMVSDISDKLRCAVEKLITERCVNEFWVGNYGFFDEIAAKAVRNAKREHPEIKLNLIIPYLTKKVSDNSEQYKEDYDNIFIAEIPAKTPRRLAILKCNEYMVKSSKFLICYVSSGEGGAAKTLSFAQKCKNIEIFNLA